MPGARRPGCGGRGRPPQPAARRAGLEAVEKLIIVATKWTNDGSCSARVNPVAVTFDRTAGCRELTGLTFGLRGDDHAGHVRAAA